MECTHCAQPLTEITAHDDPAPVHICTTTGCPLHAVHICTTGPTPAGGD